MKLTGGQALVAALKHQGVETIFGYPGGAVLPLYDVIYSQSVIRHVLVRHEQGAAHMAEGYAKATGKVGVCLATSGPGATNLVTGLTDAHMDSVPIVAITGQVRTEVIGKDAFQEADVFGITLPITKHNYLVKNAADLPRVVAEAFYIARSGRPGPVLIDVPVDVSRAIIDYAPVHKAIIRSYKPTLYGHPLQIAKAARAIEEAGRPILYVGGGVISAGGHRELTALSEKTNILVTTTLMGKGAISETHPNALGMLGMHGTATANFAVNSCDLLIAVGARFDDRVTGKIEAFAPGATVIHIDVDPSEIGKVRNPEIPIVGDARHVLAALVEQVKPREANAWTAQIRKWQQEFPLAYPQNDGKLHAQYVIEEIWNATDGEAIVSTDVGQHQMWAAQFYKCRNPRQFITSGGLGTMGFGFPAAVGAQFGAPDKHVFAIVGDGGFQMTDQEMMTAVVNRLPVKIAILNNGYLGMVRQWQEIFWDGHYSEVDLFQSPDFVKLADAYGAAGLRVERAEDVVPALRESLAITDRPTLIDFRVAREENVYPMIPSGQTVRDMILSPEEAAAASLKARAAVPAPASLAFSQDAAPVAPRPSSPAPKPAPVEVSS